MENKKLNIGIFCDSFYPMVDGVVQVVDNYARYLSEFCNVTVFVPKGRKDYKDNFPYKVVRSSIMRVFFLDYDLPLPKLDSKFKKELNRANLDIVHIHSPFTMGKIGLDYAKKHKIPCIATMHSQFKKDFKRSAKSPFLAPVVELLMTIIRGVFNSTTENWAVNGEVARIFYEDYKIKRQPIVMLNGTDMHPFEDKEYLLSLREKYQIQDDEKVLLFVGRLNLLKNLSFLVKSLKELKSKGFKFKMLFVGTGQDEDIVKREVKKLKLNDCVLFIGKISNRNELAAHYALADLFTFPSLYDCSSLVQIEAASQKTPALFLQGAATADTVTAEVNGYLAENSTEKYADKIIEIFSDKEKYLKVCQNAFDDLYLPWPKVVKNAFDRYQLVIEENKKALEQVAAEKAEKKARRLENRPAKSAGRKLKTKTSTAKK